ncbi:MAG: hypothetical protein WCO84_07370 [bacterium]
MKTKINNNGNDTIAELLITALGGLSLIAFFLNFFGFFPMAFGWFVVCIILMWLIFLVKGWGPDPSNQPSQYTGTIHVSTNTPGPWDKVPCKDCNGSGRCQYCYGTGKFGKGAVYGSKSSTSCGPCSSSGACRRCEGTGMSK